MTTTLDGPFGVLGFDLSLTETGVAYPDGSTGVIRPKGTGDDRLLSIADQVHDIVTDPVFDPTHVIIEGPFTSMRGGSTVVLGMVQGAVRCVLLRQGIPYVVVPPATLKLYATGKGGGVGTDKGSMRMALFRRTELDIVNDNEVDAAWLRLLGLDLLGTPEHVMPQTHRRALERLVVGQVTA